MLRDRGTLKPAIRFKDEFAGLGSKKSTKITLNLIDIINSNQSEPSNSVPTLSSFPMLNSHYLAFIVGTSVMFEVDYRSLTIFLLFSTLRYNKTNWHALTSVNYCISFNSLLSISLIFAYINIHSKPLLY